MTYLFIFAHPDDESVACAGTIKQLIETGQRVIVISVTDGSAGEVSETARKVYGQMSTSDIRKLEFENAMKHLGVTEFEIMGYLDGQITNIQVWGQLKNDIIALFNRYRPGVVITFDHTGWYYHLDHVATSIATTWAFHDEKTSVTALLYSHFRPDGAIKWNYKFVQNMPITHQVKVRDIEHKLTACNIHQSQDLQVVKDYLISKPNQYEYFEWGFGDEETKLTLESQMFEEFKS